MVKIKVKEMVSYAGHSLSANGLINVTFSAMYGELVNTIETMQLLNNDIKVMAKLDGEVKQVGLFKLKNINVGGDGQSKIKLQGIADYVNLDVLNEFPRKGDVSAEFAVMFIAEIEEETEKES